MYPPEAKDIALHVTITKLSPAFQSLEFQITPFPWTAIQWDTAVPQEGLS